MKRFMISDNHFGHKNIINYESRPFENTDEMEKEMIKTWNETVAKDDEVFHLGDFAFLGKEKTKEIVSKLNGKIHLILGNHDHKPIKYYLECGFETVSAYPIILDGFWILSHEPVYLNKAMPYANIHGHLHSTELTGNYFNVSVELINYKPVDFEKIKRVVGEKIKNEALETIERIKNEI